MSIRQPASGGQPPESGNDVPPTPEAPTPEALPADALPADAPPVAGSPAAGPSAPAPPAAPKPPAADPPLGRAGRIGVAVAVALLVALGVVLFAALRDSPGPDTPGGTAGAPAPATGGAAPPGASGAPPSQAAAPAASAAAGVPPAGATGAHAASGAIGALTEASLTIADGAAGVTLTAADLGDDLYRVQTPNNGALVPKVDNASGSVTVRLRPSGTQGPGSVAMAISNKVVWRLKLTGSAAQQTLDLSGGRLAGLDFAGGSGQIDLKLPVPSGTMKVAMTGGAGQVRIHVPRAAPAQAKLGGGAGTATVDTTTKQSVQPGTTITPPDWARATNRYDVDATAGLSSLIIDRY